MEIDRRCLVLLVDQVNATCRAANKRLHPFAEGRRGGGVGRIWPGDDREFHGHDVPARDMAGTKPGGEECEAGEYGIQ